MYKHNVPSACYSHHRNPQVYMMTYCLVAYGIPMFVMMVEYNLYYLLYDGKHVGLKYMKNEKQRRVHI